MSAPSRVRRAVTGVVAAAASVVAMAWGAAAATAADPAQVALRVGDVYASPAVPGADTPAARDRLDETARRLRGEGRPVKIAVVPGPAGAPSIGAYTRRLRRDLAFTGTLVVTAAAGQLAVLGPRAPAAITLDLRAARVGRIADPVERAVRAAEVSVPPAPPPEGNITARGLGGIIGLAVLGGLWAVAWGLRREHRAERNVLGEARADVQVRADALRARAEALTRRPDLPAEGRALVDRALVAVSGVGAALKAGNARAAVEQALPELRAGERDLIEAAALVGERLDPDHPFDGLCAVDPGHGPAVAQRATADRDDPVPVCGACAALVDSGAPPARRMVPRDGRPVPFDEAGRDLTEVAGARR